MHERFTRQHRQLGRTAALAVFLLTIAYAVTLVLGLLSLRSPEDPIGDPCFFLLELLIVAMAPLMVIVMVAVHAYASPGTRAYKSYGACTRAPSRGHHLQRPLRYPYSKPSDSVCGIPMGFALLLL